MFQAPLKIGKLPHRRGITGTLRLNCNDRRQLLVQEKDVVALAEHNMRRWPSKSSVQQIQDQPSAKRSLPPISGHVEAPGIRLASVQDLPQDAHFVW